MYLLTLINMIKITRSNLDYNIYILSDIKRDNISKKVDFPSDNLSSYYRAKNTIRDYAKNNNFNYFITITIDNRKFDISNELSIKKKLLKHFNNFKNRYDSTFKYIIVAERGKKNNRLHFHGLVILNNKECLQHIGFGKYKDKWLFDNFGANCFVPILKYDLKVVNYISKYITKDSYLSHIYKFNYFCSNGLSKSRVIYCKDSCCKFDKYLKEHHVDSFISWLVSNNLLVDYQFCSYANLSIDMFEQFFTTHNFEDNDKIKQLSFNDLV